MTAGLTPVIAATTQWLLRAYPAVGGPVKTALAEAQARQAVTVAAWLRYPTAMDVELLRLLGPGGSGRLDWLVHADPATHDPEQQAWRTWVDETVASWAACLLIEPALAAAAVPALDGGEHTGTAPVVFRRLTDPDPHDRQAARLLRDPDFVAPVAGLHRAQLAALLATALTDPS